jgi:thioredoxin reductase/ferredoxin
MIWGATLAVATAVVLPYALMFHRRRRRDHARLVEAQGLGIDRPTAQFPYVDASRCIGCGTCVKACPEGDVLGVVGGTAVVVNGLRCVGHARCEEVCPVGALEVGLGDVKGRADLPVMDEWQESTAPGVFLAGELSGMALIRNAVEQGRRVVERIAERQANEPLLLASRRQDPSVVDLAIVGAGPAGLSAALAAKEQGLSYVLLEQEQSLGGTVLNFPRRKLVLTRPVRLPLGGSLDREEYSKEALLELFSGELLRHRLTVRFGERLSDVVRDGEALRVETNVGSHRARQVVLCLGRRGTPRRLAVPGEEQAKVMYQLRDAESYRSQKVLIVGGGDSAIEAAIGLGRQPNNQVTISYRKEGFFRIKQKNQQAIERLIARGKVRALFGTEVAAITADAVTLRTAASDGGKLITLPNDVVFVLIGGDPPFALLRRIGIRFGGDPPANLPSPPRAASFPLPSAGHRVQASGEPPSAARPHAAACDSATSPAPGNTADRAAPELLLDLSAR